MGEAVVQGITVGVTFCFRECEVKQLANVNVLGSLRKGPIGVAQQGRVTFNAPALEREIESEGQTTRSKMRGYGVSARFVRQSENAVVDRIVIMMDGEVHA